MLSERDAIRAREILGQLRSRAIRPDAEFLKDLRALDYAAAHIEENPALCDWLAWCSRNRELFCDIRDRLAGIRCGAGKANAALNPPSARMEILDHHFWNDVMPFWSGMKGRYGDSPGEDVLIKLVARAYLKTS